MSDARPPVGNLRGAVDLSSLVRPRQQPKPPAEGPQGGEPGSGLAAAPGVVLEARDESFSAVLDLSSRVPVIVEFYAQGIEPSLGPIVTSYGGRLVLATVDGNANPQVAQAFQVQQVPAVAAVVAGRPLQLFVGMPEEDEVRQVLDQVLQLAAQNGVTGSVPVGDAEEAAPEPEEPPLPPLHQEAYDAIARGDFEAAVKAYSTAIAQDPRDSMAVAGLAQTKLLQRLDGLVAADVLSAAAERPKDVDAQLAVADLDISGGHVDDAFDRLLEVFPSLKPDEKDQIRVRLLEYFEIVGAEDPRVIAARRRLTMLLY